MSSTEKLAQELTRSQANDKVGQDCDCGRGKLEIHPSHDAVEGNGVELRCATGCGFRRDICADN